MLHTPLPEAKGGEALQIDGSLVGGDKIEKVVLKYRGPGGEYAEAPMELQYGDLYRGFVPAVKMVFPGVEYYLEGVTFSGERVPLFFSASQPARVWVRGELPVKERRGSKESRLDSARPERTKRQKNAEKEPITLPLSQRERDAELEEELALYSAEDTVALATRHEEKVTRVPAIASSFSREQIRALGARTVYDVLDVVPGLSISRDVQGFHRTAVRGLRSDPEVLFLLDGHRLDNFFDGRALANLPVENLERIEVIRGPGSALHGAGAFLGVVNLVTRREEGVSLSAAAGLYDAYDTHLAAAKSMGSAKLSADADYSTQRGERRSITKDSLDRDTIVQELRGPLDPAGFTHDQRTFANAGVRLEYTGAGGGKLGAWGRFLLEDRAALLGLFDAVGNDSRLFWQVAQADLSYETQAGERTRVFFHGWFDDQLTRRTFQLSPRNFRTGSAPNQLFPEGLLERAIVGVRTLGGSGAADLQLAEGNRLSFGVVVEQQSLYRYEYETNYDSQNLYLGTTLTRPTTCVGTECVPLAYPQDRGQGAATSRLRAGLYAQDQWTLGAPLTLTFGFRLDAIQLPKLDDERNVIGAELVFSLNPRAGLVFSASDSLVLKLLYGRAFRPPTVQELVESIPNTQYNLGRFEGNPDLDPASVDTVEVGADWVQAAGEARVRLRGAVYYQHFTNPIALVDTTGNIVPLRNRQQGVRVFGAEGEARLEASERANAWVNASWFRAEDLETATQARLLTDVPQARFNAGTSMPLGEWMNLDLLVRVGSERRNNSRSVLELVRRWKIPSYALVSAQLRTQRIADHFELSLAGHNLFSHDWVDDVPRADRVPGLLPRETLSAFLTVRAFL
ncbi:MAG: TonB-dependent receptor plug domain-containing protein [Myxococcota bacterium]